MKSLIAIAILLIILTTCFLAEMFLVKTFYSKLDLCIEDITYSLENDSMSAVCEKTKVLTGHWEKYKNYLYIFENHSYFRNIEDEIHRIEFYVGNNEKRNISFALHNISKSSKAAKYDFSLLPGNIF